MKTLMFVAAACLLAACGSSERLARVEDIHQHETWSPNDRVRIGITGPVIPSTGMLMVGGEHRSAADLRGPDTFVGMGLRVARDSVSWTDVETAHPRSVASSVISSLAFRSTGKGVLNGLGLGVLIGGGVGIAAAAIVSAGEEGPSDLTGLAYLYFGGGGIGLGAVAGMIAGAIVGGEEEYEIVGVED